jgi:carbon monoxide dehydrogenase subunit G
MNLRGEVVVAAGPEAVWAGLTDAALLGRLVPGCESFTGDMARGYAVVAARQVGGLTVRLAGRIDLHEVEPGRGCRVRAAGEGLGVGRAGGEGRVRLRPEGAGTRLSYEAEARLSGPLGRVPGFVVRLVAQRVVDAFFVRFDAALAAARPGTLTPR